VDEVKDFGTVRFDKNFRVEKFQEKGHSGAGFVNAGVYCFNRSLLSAMRSGKQSLEVDCFPQWISRGFYAYETDAGFWDIGTPERLKLIKEKIK
jgi:NDP-sugar pyrophosphorylase family protein